MLSIKRIVILSEGRRGRPQSKDLHFRMPMKSDYRMPQVFVRRGG